MRSSVSWRTLTGQGYSNDATYHGDELQAAHELPPIDPGREGSGEQIVSNLCDYMFFMIALKFTDYVRFVYLRTDSSASID